MSALDDLKKTYAKLEAEIAEIDAKAAPIIAEGKKLNEQIQPLLAKQRELSAKLKPLRDESYVEKRKLLGRFAVALGGKSLKAEPMR